MYNRQISADIRSQIKNAQIQLSLEARQRSLEYLHLLRLIGTGISVTSLAKHSGSIDSGEGRLMIEAIEAQFEQVNLIEW